MKIPKILSGTIAGVMLGSAQAQDAPGLVQTSHNDVDVVSGCTSDNHYVELDLKATATIESTKEKKDIYQTLYGLLVAARDGQFEKAVTEFSASDLREAFDRYAAGEPLFEIPTLKTLSEALKPLENAFDRGVEGQTISGHINHTLVGVRIAEVPGTQECTP